MTLLYALSLLLSPPVDTNACFRSGTKKSFFIQIPFLIENYRSKVSVPVFVNFWPLLSTASTVKP